MRNVGIAMKNFTIADRYFGEINLNVIPDSSLPSTPLRVLSLGAGVQSSTLALMAVHGDIPMYDCAIFADTQSEPKYVYDWLDWLEKQLAFPVHRVTKGSLQDESLRLHKSKRTDLNYLKSYIPAFVTVQEQKSGVWMRMCTVDFKIKLIERKIRELLGVKRFSKKMPVLVEQSIGISLDEFSRMKPSLIPAIKNVFPLLEMNMTRLDCIEWMLNHGYPEPPKSSCSFCPYHNDELWEDLRVNHPQDFQKAVEYERKLQQLAKEDDVTTGTPYLHQSCIPLDQVKFTKKLKTGKLHQTNLFINECSGHCGV